MIFYSYDEFAIDAKKMAKQIKDEFDPENWKKVENSEIFKEKSIRFNRTYVICTILWCW